MSIHRSLAARDKLIRHRNVLSRAERVKMLAKEDKWKESDSIFGLPKVKHILQKVRAKAKKKEEAAALPGAVAAGAPATGAPPTAATKAAAPAPATTPEKKPKEKAETKK